MTHHDKRSIPFEDHEQVISELKDSHRSALESAKSASFWNGFVGGIGFTTMMFVIGFLLI